MRLKGTLSKEQVTLLIREAFPAVPARVLQKLLGAYLNKQDMWHAVFENQVYLSYWAETKFEALITKIEEMEQAL